MNTPTTQKKNNIAFGIRLNYERLEALEAVFKAIAADFSSDEEHEQLLAAYMVVINNRLSSMVEKNQAIYTLNFNPAEALALKQVWDRAGRYQDRYAQVVVGDLIKKVNALHKK